MPKGRSHHFREHLRVENYLWMIAWYELLRLSCFSACNSAMYSSIKSHESIIVKVLITNPLRSKRVI